MVKTLLIFIGFIAVTGYAADTDCSPAIGPNGLELFLPKDCQILAGSGPFNFTAAGGTGVYRFSIGCSACSVGTVDGSTFTPADKIGRPGTSVTCNVMVTDSATPTPNQVATTFELVQP